MASASSSSSSLSPKLCASCKSTSSSLFCNADSAFLCFPCDSKIHAANNLSARHSRFVLCDVCEQAPAHVTCKADAANLCVTCDLDIHSANPLARRHVRLPVAAFSHASVDLNDVVDDCCEEEEGEEASWLISSLNPSCAKVGEEMESYFDFEYGLVNEKIHLVKEEEKENLKSDLDCVVPVQMKNHDDVSFVNGGGSCLDSGFDMDFLGSDTKAFSSFYNSNNGQSLSNSVSSSSFDIELVPDTIAMIDISNPFGRHYKELSDSTNQAVPVLGIDREARVLRYKEKRKNRKFEKTIRYASRKAYAETRPRVKGRFVKRPELHMDHIYADSLSLTDYGIVPTFSELHVTNYSLH